MAANVAAVALSIVGGADLSDKINPRLVELRLTEKRENDADQIEITLQNADGKLIVPEPDKQLALKIGWQSGKDVPLGMVDKGTFVVDEVAEEGPPDVVTIRARSADLKGRYRKRRTRIWKKTTLGAIIGEIAQRNDRQARVAASLAQLAVDVIEQEGKSDMAFVRDLGRRFDAIATWKAGVLLFAPIGASASIGGTPLATVTLTRQDGNKWRFTRAEREGNDGVEAQWHDASAGRRRTVKTGGKNRRKLKRVYASEAEAKRAAQSAAKRSARQPYSFEYDLAIADPALQPDTRVTLKGWSSKIDAIKWLVVSVETSFGANGLMQKVVLEGL